METAGSVGERLDHNGLVNNSGLPEYGSNNSLSSLSSASLSSRPSQHDRRHLRAQSSLSDTKLDSLASSSKRKRNRMAEKSKLSHTIDRSGFEDSTLSEGTVQRDQLLAAGSKSIDENELSADSESLVSEDFSHSDVDHEVTGPDNSNAVQERLNRMTSTVTSNVDKAVEELLITEASYIRDLHDVIFGYMQYIGQTLKVSRQDFMHLFGNITEIYEFNRKFLVLLEKNRADPVMIAHCFIQEHNGFIIYSDYCTNYPRSVEVLGRWMKDINIAEALKRQQLALHHGLPMGTYLFKPVQRILRYHLLLKSIQSYHPEDAEGHEVIDAALDHVVAIATHINEVKRAHDRFMRAQEIYSVLTGYQRVDLTALGDLVLEDVFRMSGAWGDRHVFLFRKALIIAKKKKVPTATLR